MTHSITAQWLAANRLVNPYLKSGTAAKAPFTKLRSSSLPRATTPKVTSSKTQSSTKRVRTRSGSFDEFLDDQAIAQSSSIRSNSEVAMTLSLWKVLVVASSKGIGVADLPCASTSPARSTQFWPGYGPADRALPDVRAAAQKANVNFNSLHVESHQEIAKAISVIPNSPRSIPLRQRVRLTHHLG